MVVKARFFLARLGVIAFFCNYRDRKTEAEAIHHCLRGLAEKVKSEELRMNNLRMESCIIIFSTKNNFASFD